MLEVEQIISTDTFANLSSFLGSDGNSTITNMINKYCEEKGGGTVFAMNSSQNVIDHLNIFYERVLEPEKKANLQVQQSLSMMRLDAIRYITSVAELESGIPVSMHEAILTFPPVRELLNNGMISGWGIKPWDLHPEDRWGRLCNNGRVEELENYNVGDAVRFISEYYGDDPIVSYDELRAVRYTREWIGEFLEKTNYDITSYPNKKGKLKTKKKR